MTNKHPTPDSSTINSIDHADGKLIVEFKSGGTYHYDAPESVYHEMKAAPSVGKFLHANVIGKFGHVKAVIIIALMLFASNANAATMDLVCMQQCEAQGYSYGLCVKQCSL